jgi:hypothetical protein
MDKHAISFPFLEKKKTKYRIFPFIVGKCGSQLQTVSGPGHGQNHHNGLAGSHH